MSKFRSGFSDLIEKYMNYRKASGSWSENGQGLSICYFDRFCADNYPEKPLSQEMIDEWCARRGTESNSSCAARTRPIRSFISYLQERHLTDTVHAKLPKAEKKTCTPHAFSREELERFFRECDSIVPYKQSPKFLLPKMTCPIFFRLLYSSGIRTTEARLLKHKDVDLTQGVLNIRQSKGYDQHYVALHESMTLLLRQYDNAVSIIYPDRAWFFEPACGGHYSRGWVVNNFRTLWVKANGEENRAVAYDLRHHYAITNINSWTEDTFEFSDKLHYLSKSMGHRQIEATLYYYSIVPGLANTLLAKTESGFDEIVPEVPDEEE